MLHKICIVSFVFLRVKDVPEKANQVLQLLRLNKQHQGVFLRLNKTTLLLLEMIDQFITWGHPNLRTVRELIFKRGTGKSSAKSEGRKALSDNTFIEQALGKLCSLRSYTQNPHMSLLVQHNVYHQQPLVLQFSMLEKDSL